MIPITRMGIVGRRRKATVTLTANAVDTGDLTTYTFSAQSLGVAAANRRIVIGVVGQQATTATVTSLTVAGISASLVIAANNGNSVAELWIADVPTGTTGDVVVTFTGSKGDCGIGVHRLIGVKSVAFATATSVADPMSASLSIPSNGIAIGVAEDVSTSTYIWTNLTERYDEQVDAAASQTGASDDNANAQTPTITCNPSNAATLPAMALASWAPQ